MVLLRVRHPVTFNYLTFATDSMLDDSNTTLKNETEQSLVFARFLKFWRGVHQISQQELAFRINSSARHISRLESGSSRPSESMVMEISNSLELGNRDRNHLLIAAGFAPTQSKVDIHSPELKWLRKAMTMNLRALDPYPTVLLDSAANIVMVNRSWVSFFQHSIDHETLQQADNYYEFLFSPHIAGPVLRDWEDAFSLILMAVKQQTLFSNDPEEIATQRQLEANKAAPSNWQQRAAQLEPMASFRLQIELNGTQQRFYNVSSTVGALGPTAYASEPNLTIQTLYPDNEELDLSALMTNPCSHPRLFY